MLSCAPSRTRTYGLLLRRHSRSTARRRRVWPDVGSGRSETGWTWPDGALCLWTLAPRLAPRYLVSNANIRMIKTSDSSIKSLWRSTDRPPERWSLEKLVCYHC